MTKEQHLLDVLDKYNRLGISSQIDYDKFYRYSIVTHSTAIEGSTFTELENQMMLNDGIITNNKSIIEAFIYLQYI